MATGPGNHPEFAHDSIHYFHLICTRFRNRVAQQCLRIGRRHDSTNCLRTMLLIVLFWFETGYCHFEVPVSAFDVGHVRFGGFIGCWEHWADLCAELFHLRAEVGNTIGPVWVWRQVHPMVGSLYVCSVLQFLDEIRCLPHARCCTCCVGLVFICHQE